MRFIVLGLQRAFGTPQRNAHAGSDRFSYRVATYLVAMAMMNVLIVG